MAEFASKGVAGAGLGLGIAGTALGVLSGGLGNALGGILAPRQTDHGGCKDGCSDAALMAAMSMMTNSMIASAPRGCACNEDHLVNRYEAAQQARIAELETEVKLRDANTYTDSKILDLYRYVDGKFGCVEAQIAQQAVYNATNTATLSCLQNQVAALQGLTKVVIPTSSICPEVMPRYNSWTAPTTEAPAGG